MGTRVRAAQQLQLEQLRRRGVEQRRLDLRPGKSPAAPRHRRPSGTCASAGSAASPAPRPVLKSMTGHAVRSTSSRSTVPATTRPSGKVAAIGASASDAGAEQIGEGRIVEDAQTVSASSRAVGRLGDARGSLEPAQRGACRSAGSTPGSRSSSWWISVRALPRPALGLGRRRGFACPRQCRRRQRPRRAASGGAGGAPRPARPVAAIGSGAAFGLTEPAGTDPR